MNGVVSTCGNKRREKKLGVRNALGQETSDVFFYVIKRGVNHQEKNTPARRYWCENVDSLNSHFAGI